jgi:uncharacterized protein (TIGR02246 family)
MKHLHPRWIMITMLFFVPLNVACNGDADEDGAVFVAEEPAATPAMAMQIPPELELQVDGYLDAWNGNDPDAAAAFFTDDATAIVQDSTYSGLAAIRQRWLTPNVAAVSNLQVSEEMVDRRGDDLVVVGSHSYTITLPDGTTDQASGRNTTTWTRGADGSWRIRATTIQDDA